MKKIISVIMSVFLLFNLSISSIAMGNSYSFTSSWFRVLFENSVVYNNSNQASFETSGGVIAQNGLVYNADDGYNTSAIYLNTNSSVKSGTVSVTIPLNVTLYRSVEYLELEFFTSFSNTVNFVDATVRVGNSNLSTTSTAIDLDNLQFGSVVFPSASATHGTFEAEISGRGQKINVRYFKNLSSSEQVIDSITLNFTTTGSSFALGVPCVDSLVNLPDSFYDAIYSIKIFEVLRYNQMTNLLNYIESIQGQLDELMGSLGDSSSITENYYNTIINQSPEQSEQVSALQQDLAAAKQELAEMQEVIDSIDVPTFEDISTSTVDSDQLIETSLGSEEVSNVFSAFFDSGILTNLLLIVFGLATVSYILYGKRA